MLLGKAKHTVHKVFIYIALLIILRHMNNIKINLEQKNMLLEVIEQRRDEYRVQMFDPVFIEAKVPDVLIESNIIIENIYLFEKTHNVRKNICNFVSSCLNSYKIKNFKHLIYPPISEWLNLNGEFKEYLNSLDNLNNLLWQFRTKELQLDPDYRYSDFVTAMEIIKESEIVFLDEYNSVYDKVAFVLYNRFVRIELFYKLEAKAISISEINGSGIMEYGKMKYTDIVNKSEAMKKLKSSDSKSLNTETLEFVLKALEQKNDNQ